MHSKMRRNNRPVIKRYLKWWSIIRWSNVRSNQSSGDQTSGDQTSGDQRSAYQ